MNRRLVFLVFFAALVLTVTACASIDPGISEQDAVIIAKGVLAQQTHFYVKIDNETKTVSNISVTSAMAAYDGKQWNVAVHVQGNDQDGALRQNDILVMLSRKGEVLGVGAGKVPGK